MKKFFVPLKACFLNFRKRKVAGMKMFRRMRSTGTSKNGRRRFHLKGAKLEVKKLLTSTTRPRDSQSRQRPKKRVLKNLATCHEIGLETKYRIEGGEGSRKRFTCRSAPGRKVF
jgi:hypothetical protein